MADEQKKTNVKVEYSDLRKHIDALANKKRAISEATGSARAARKAVLDDTNWNASAFAMLETIENMSDSKKADFLLTFKPGFEQMIEHGGWGELLKQDLFADDGEPETPADK